MTNFEFEDNLPPETLEDVMDDIEIDQALLEQALDEDDEDE